MGLWLSNVHGSLRKAKCRQFTPENWQFSPETSNSNLKIYIWFIVDDLPLSACYMALACSTLGRFILACYIVFVVSTIEISTQTFKQRIYPEDLGPQQNSRMAGIPSFSGPSKFHPWPGLIPQMEVTQPLKRSLNPWFYPPTPKKKNTINRRSLEHQNPIFFHRNSHHDEFIGKKRSRFFTLEIHRLIHGWNFAKLGG